MKAGGALLALLVVALCLAWFNRFILDDAFISFRYADNLVRGKGLVFNEGERVEGYANFLWVLLVAAGMQVGFDPVGFSYALGILSFACSLLLTYRMARILLNSEWLGLTAAFLLGTNYTFSAYATGGLETALDACLLTGCVYITLKCFEPEERTWRKLVALSLLLASATLTRPDSLIFFGLLAPAVIFRFRSKREIWRSAGLVLGPFLLIVGTWLAWKVWYYGEIVPNTFYAKAAASMLVRDGVYYVTLFLWTYMLWPFLLIGLAGLPAVKRWPRSLLLVALTAVWTAYVIWVGGDFMEFRFMVPILPLVFIMITWLATRFVRQKAVQIALVVMVPIGSLSHVLTFGRAMKTGSIEPVTLLHEHVSDGGWVAAGRRLGEAFGQDSDVVIATTAVGAIPYYSSLTTVDMLGLNDHWVARHGIDISHWNWPGHRRLAPLNYLVERQVNLVISNPQLVNDPDLGSYCRKLWPLVMTADTLPESASMVQIPLQDEPRVLVALYLTQSPEIDEAIEREGWKVYPCH